MTEVIQDKSVFENKAKVGVVIPTFRRGKELIRCIQTLTGQSQAKFDIVVINDGGDEDVTALLRENCPWCIEITSSFDLWWTKSINFGLEYLLKNDYSAAIILNDDVTLSPAFVEKMIERYQKEEDSTLLISKVLDNDGNVWSLGGFVSWPLHGPMHLLVEASSINSARKITWSPGMGTLIPMKAIREIGFLDDQAFPQYFSDTDFGLRAINKGWKIVLNQECAVYNNISSTGGVSGVRRLKLHDLHFMLFDLRSADNLRARTTFTYRHAPFGLRTISLVIRLSKVLAFFVKRII